MMRQFKNLRIGRAYPLLVIVKWHTDPFSQFTTVHPRYHPPKQPTNVQTNLSSLNQARCHRN